MKPFIHSIWRGEASPGEMESAENPKIAQQLFLQDRHRERLLSLLTEEETEIFRKYEDCEQEKDWLAQEDAFAEGIRFAVRFMTEALG